MTSMLKIFSTIIAVLVATVGTTTPTQAAEYNNYTCSARIDRTTLYYDGAWWKNVRRDVEVVAAVFYQYCVPADPDRYEYVKPTKTITSYRVDEATTECDYLFTLNRQWFDGIYANYYFFRPYTGQNYNPPKYAVDCDESGKNAEIQTYSSSLVPRLFFGPGTNKPKWSVNIELRIVERLNEYRSHTQVFKP